MIIALEAETELFSLSVDKEEIRELYKGLESRINETNANIDIASRMQRQLGVILDD